MPRKFKAVHARRESVPMLVGLVGASGSGKTKSALRIATGMQQVVGGKIFCVDTEARRALHYADEFQFEHVEFNAPFSPNDYLEVIKFCKNEGATIIIVDSMSHEHEGPGGVLEMHEAEVDRMAGTTDYAKRNRVSIGAWAMPKAQRRNLINEVLRMGINGIFCFRAKEKIKLVSGKDPLQLGWQPIGGEEFVFEMMANCLLYPHSNGVPTWDPDQRAEKVMTKFPDYLAHCFPEYQTLCEETGMLIAQWAQGDIKPSEELAAAIAEIGQSDSEELLRALLGSMKESLVPGLTPLEREKLRVAARDRRAVWASAKPDPSAGGANSPGTGDPTASPEGRVAEELDDRKGFDGPIRDDPAAEQEEVGSAPPSSEPERDPDTNEVIPDSVGSS